MPYRYITDGVIGLTVDLRHAHLDMALGHEGVGVVEELGPAAKVLKVGDRVGWGFMHDDGTHFVPSESFTETRTSIKEVLRMVLFGMRDSCSNCPTTSPMSMLHHW